MCSSNEEVVDAEESTPQQNNSKIQDDVELLNLFFELSKDRHEEMEIDVQDKLGNTPLHLAVKNDNKEMVKSLLKRGADPNKVNANGSTPLHIICEGTRDLRMVEILFDYMDAKYNKLNLDTQDKLGNTPMHLALERGGDATINLVRFLLRKKANAHLRNNKDDTPLQVVCRRDGEEHDIHNFMMLILQEADGFEM